ncbi:hypothetical protein M758_3G218700 [Ceratodon purpureus]|nr:hypothetical protein M758_3G218700 [Ceratodon purpureus]KAG0624033.1 hypothetical protein M758_3G218700 [Ceratodon purpureus]KAG0624035.1 hypothetical protein M758_3G218700 [Ceratodon purpureus]
MEYFLTPSSEVISSSLQDIASDSASFPHPVGIRSLRKDESDWYEALQYKDSYEGLQYVGWYEDLQVEDWYEDLENEDCYEDLENEDLTPEQENRLRQMEYFWTPSCEVISSSLQDIVSGSASPPHFVGIRSLRKDESDWDELLENEDLTLEQENRRQMEYFWTPSSEMSSLQKLEWIPPHLEYIRSLREGETWMPGEVVDNNEKLMSTLAPLFKKLVENALEPILGPVASILRSQGEEEWKRQETLFALEERQLALRSEKIQLKRRRLGLSQRRRRSSSTKPLRPRIRLEHRHKFPRKK